MPEHEKVITNFIDEKEGNQESLFFIPENSISGEFTDEPVRGTLCIKDSFGDYVKISNLINQKANLQKSGFPDSTILNTRQGFKINALLLDFFQKTTRFSDSNQFISTRTYRFVKIPLEKKPLFEQRYN